MVPQSFVERITVLAAEIGHIGVVIAGGAVGRSTDRQAKSVCQHFQRIEKVNVACPKSEIVAKSDYKEILISTDGYFELNTSAACADRHLSFWHGNGFRKDHTVVGLAPLTSLITDPILAESMDPFIQGNALAFAGSRGLGLIRNLISTDEKKIASVMIGSPVHMYFFARSDAMRELIPLLFKRVNFSERYIDYSKGAFLPVEIALRQIRKKAFD